ncbi:MAG TPA: transporter substrate-binding domain-containing protein [Phototrophicaceae bacterium]|nr:transporter substrate-binding domain-containing protein [Phototrophicaceae bacterium]
MMKRRSLFLLVLLIGMISIGTSAVYSQNQAVTLRVAVKSFPPFVMAQGDVYTGFSIDLWNAIAQEVGVNTRFVGVETVDDQLNAVKNGQADAALAGITITEQREEQVDFSYPYFDSGLQILVRLTPESPITSGLNALLSSALLQYMAVFLLLIVVIAHVYWLFERRHPEFPRSYRAGIGQLIWWSTLTVLGYDTHPPGTRAGRIIAIVWMFAGIFLIANLIAVLSAGETVRQLRSDIQSVADLRGERVVTVAGTTSADYLRANGIPFTSVSVIDDAYPLLLNGQADALVYDAPVLRYYLATAGRPDLSLVGAVVEPEKYGIALPTGSSYRKAINEAILKLQEAGTYQQIYQRWFGSDAN